MVELDRATICLFVVMAAFIVAGVTYGVYADDRYPDPPTVPETPDGVYEYNVWFDVDNIGIMVPSQAVVVSGSLESLTVNGEALSADEVSERAENINSFLDNARTASGPSWTDGEGVVSTVMATNGIDTMVFSTDGLMLQYMHASETSSVTATLNGWSEVVEGE